MDINNIDISFAQHTTNNAHMSKAIYSNQKKKPKQHQDFDNIVKKTFAKVYQSIIHKLLGLDLKNTVKIPTTFSRTKEKRSDFAIKVSPPNEVPHIVHIEFQSRNDKRMDRRELGYYNDFYWEYGLEIIQYVIYMGNGEPTMKTEIIHRNLTLRYKIIVLNQIDVQLFLNSNDPHEIILAVLCKYERKEAPVIIKRILEKLKAKAQNEGDLHEYVTDLEILSGLRKLQSETKKQISKMPIVYDITKDIRFKEGKLEGKLEGELEGELKKARTSAIRLLKQGVLTPIMIAEGLEVPLSFVLKIQKELQKNPDLK